jgi:hypothetical protein
MELSMDSQTYLHSQIDYGYGSSITTEVNRWGTAAAYRSLIKTCNGAEYSLLEDGVGRFIWHYENCVWEFQAERIAMSYLEALLSNTYEVMWNKLDPSAW